MLGDGMCDDVAGAALALVMGRLDACSLVALSETCAQMLRATDLEWGYRSARYAAHGPVSKSKKAVPRLAARWGLTRADLKPCWQSFGMCVWKARVVALEKHGGPRGMWRRHPDRHADLKRRVAIWVRVCSFMELTPTQMHEMVEPFLRTGANEAWLVASVIGCLCDRFAVRVCYKFEKPTKLCDTLAAQNFAAQNFASAAS